MRSRIALQSLVAAMPRPAAPSRRAGRADMSRMGFIGLVAGWSGVVALIFAISAFIRFVA
jgi:hypothetical protein